MGLTVRPGDIEGLIEAIRTLKDDEGRRLEIGQRARWVFEAEWDKPIALAKWRALIESLGKS